MCQAEDFWSYFSISGAINVDIVELLVRLDGCILISREYTRFPFTCKYIFFSNVQKASNKNKQC